MPNRWSHAHSTSAKSASRVLLPKPLPHPTSPVSSFPSGALIWVTSTQYSHSCPFSYLYLPLKLLLHQEKYNEKQALKQVSLEVNQIFCADRFAIYIQIPLSCRETNIMSYVSQTSVFFKSIPIDLNLQLNTVCYTNKRAKV